MGAVGQSSASKWRQQPHQCYIRYNPMCRVEPSIAFRPALFICGIDAIRCLKHSSDILIHINMIAADLLTPHLWCKSPVPPHPKVPLWEFMTVRGHLRTLGSLSCLTNEFEMICTFWHGRLSCSHQKMGALRSSEDRLDHQQYSGYSGRLWYLNDQLVLRSPVCAKKISP